MRGSEGFGNARAARNLLESVAERQSARIVAARRRGNHPDLYAYSRCDVLGPRTLDRDCAALTALKSMHGLKAVKRSVEQLLLLVESNALREDDERPVQDVVPPLRLVSRVFPRIVAKSKSGPTRHLRL